MGKFFILLILIAAGGLFATKPTQKDTDRLYVDKIRTEIAAIPLEGGARNGDEAVARLLIVACQVFEGTCAEAVHKLHDFEYVDLQLFALYNVYAGQEQVNACVAILNQLICGQDLT